MNNVDGRRCTHEQARVMVTESTNHSTRMQCVYSVTMTLQYTIVTTTDLCDTRVSCVGLVAGRAGQYIQAQGQGRFQNLPGTLEGLQRGGALCMPVQQGRRRRQ